MSGGPAAAPAGRPEVPEATVELVLAYLGPQPPQGWSAAELRLVAREVLAEFSGARIQTYVHLLAGRGLRDRIRAGLRTEAADAEAMSEPAGQAAAEGASGSFSGIGGVQS